MGIIFITLMVMFFLIVALLCGGIGDLKDKYPMFFVIFWFVVMIVFFFLWAKYG